MNSSGYSGTPLAKKLGIKDGFKIKLVNQPDYYFNLFESLPEKIEFIHDRKTRKDFVHFFVKDAGVLEKEIVSLKKEIVPNGMIWISWPKKSSKVVTDITEDLIRKLALTHGLVDVKVCAVDDVWSGLKLVIPLKDRSSEK